MPQIVISERNRIIEGMRYTGSLSAYLLHPDGRPYHTFRSYTVLVDGENLTFRHCRIENTAGRGAEAGQAIALYLDGDRIVLEDCILRGHQDTLFLAPLPEREREKDGFLGPKQLLPRTPRVFRFRRCRIEGGVDFIFGGAEAYFDDCEFRSVEPGFVFAPSTPEGQKTGFVARNCRFTCTETVPDRSCYIGRPWRDHARLRLEHCELGRHIHPCGFDDWGRTECHKTVRFEEIGSYGPGAENTDRPDYVLRSESCMHAHSPAVGTAAGISAAVPGAG